ncbi:DUF2971 domain-containing protein [Bacillus pumilus]|uniref:DUF2971 domain-containing protein n=1 Tax=Bacillus pumilus TaxID=1408 RepID=UPI00145C2BF6|nr:DUF2971 domain-containing protein [Bacillus pumilus]
MNDLEQYNRFFRGHVSKVISDKPTPENIFHYTNIYGLKGILENNMFWVSHIDFLNDMTEIKYTLRLCKEIMLSLCEEELNQSETDFVMGEYDNLIEDYFTKNKMNYYSLSFSTNSDSNLLWSNYSQNDGYCIKFDIEKLVENYKISESQILYSHVNYDITKQKAILKNLALKNIFDYLKIFSGKSELSAKELAKFLVNLSEADISSLLEELSDRISSDDIEKLSEQLSKTDISGVSDNLSNKNIAQLALVVTAVILNGGLEFIHCCSIFFKDECFSQEEEFRLAIHVPQNKESFDCRISNGTFIPYIEMQFQKDAVHGVTIGPKNNMDINLEGLRKFLELKGIQIPDDEIKKSRIPYRF